MNKLETVYFAVVDYIDFITREVVLDNEQLILSEDDYDRYSKNDDTDDVFIVWSEMYEVLRISDTHYIIVNYENMSGERFENVFDNLFVEKLGKLEKVVKTDTGKSNIVSSIDYFNLDTTELLVVDDSGKTKEEILLESLGSNATFFDDIDEYKKFREDHLTWLKRKGMVVTNLIETVNQRLAVIANFDGSKNA